MAVLVHVRHISALSRVKKKSTPGGSRTPLEANKPDFFLKPSYILSSTSMLRITRISARPFLSNLSRSFSSSLPRSKERLVILGSGWGGYEVLRGVDKNHWGASDSLP